MTYPPGISPPFRSFLEGLLSKTPARRLDWPALLEHPFVRGAEPGGCWGLGFRVQCSGVAGGGLPLGWATRSSWGRGAAGGGCSSTGGLWPALLGRPLVRGVGGAAGAAVGGGPLRLRCPQAGLSINSLLACLIVCPLLFASLAMHAWSSMHMPCVLVTRFCFLVPCREAPAASCHGWRPLGRPNPSCRRRRRHHPRP